MYVVAYAQFERQADLGQKNAIMDNFTRPLGCIVAISRICFGRKTRDSEKATSARTIVRKGDDMLEIAAST